MEGGTVRRLVSAMSLSPHGVWLNTVAASENTLQANFVESPKGEVRRILILGTSVNKPNICFAFIANSSPSLHCEQRSFREGEEG
jgi:hypothetical protein